MAETTKTDTNVILHNVVRITTVSVKADGESKHSKKVNVRTTIDNVSMDSVIADALRTDNIRFQRELRKRFDTLTVGETLERTYGAKVGMVISMEVAQNAYVSYLSTLSPEDRKAELDKLAKK